VSTEIAFIFTVNLQTNKKEEDEKSINPGYGAAVCRWCIYGRQWQKEEMCQRKAMLLKS
jgi:hypothetical protein